MKNLEKKTEEKFLTRRNLLKLALTGAGAGIASACKTLLPVNTAGGFGEGIVDVSEDAISMQQVGFYGVNYFAIPLNNEKEILEGGEPSFALIPRSRAIISVEKVGEEGGKVTVYPASSSDFYLPYVYAVEKDSEGKIREKKISADFKNIKPVILKTNFYMKDALQPEAEEGNISIMELSEDEFPFSDESLNSINGARYLVNKAEDFQKLPGRDGEKNKVLELYFTIFPFDVQYNESKEDRKIRISGKTFLYRSGESPESYKSGRGFKPIGNYLPTASTDSENAEKATSATTE